MEQRNRNASKNSFIAKATTLLMLTFITLGLATNEAAGITETNIDVCKEMNMSLKNGRMENNRVAQTQRSKPKEKEALEGKIRKKISEISIYQNLKPLFVGSAYIILGLAWIIKLVLDSIKKLGKFIWAKMRKLEWCKRLIEQLNTMKSNRECRRREKLKAKKETLKKKVEITLKNEWRMTHRGDEDEEWNQKSYYSNNKVELEMTIPKDVEFNYIELSVQGERNKCHVTVHENDVEEMVARLKKMTK